MSAIADHATPIATDQPMRCNTLDDTRKFAETFAKMLSPGSVVALTGELGAGKTTLIRMLARELGYAGVVSSPTFTLMNIYEAEAATIYHFDFYRLSDTHEAYGIGADEYIEGDGIVFIEWPEKTPGLLPERYFEIAISIPDYSQSPTVREITLRKIF